ncbi:transposase [Streptococcus pneumoniae]|nr:transposase [Streptococcus pneumoniae]VSY66419.1 transposase [Streptococcus pneumoniae]VTC85284.1 transposase [Streptococcus pneumoniae]
MKLTKEEIQTIKTLLKDSRTAKYHKRLQIVLFRLMGKSYKEIIELLDCNQTTIWRNITPRPEHPKKADAQTIVASKNKISIQEDKKAL